MINRGGMSPSLSRQGSGRKMKSETQSRRIPHVPAERRTTQGRTSHARSRSQELADLRARVRRAKTALEELEEAQIVDKETLELEFTV